MARKRMIDPHIWEDPDFNKASINARFLFIGMISNADDEGYIRADSGSLKRLLFGFDLLSPTSVEGWIKELDKKIKNVHFFDVKNEKYAHFLNWDKYQKQREDRRQKSTYPKCPRCKHFLSSNSVEGQTDDGQASGKWQTSGGQTTTIRQSDDGQVSHIRMTLDTQRKGRKGKEVSKVKRRKGDVRHLPDTHEISFQLKNWNERQPRPIANFKAENIVKKYGPTKVFAAMREFGNREDGFNIMLNMLKERL